MPEPRASMDKMPWAVDPDRLMHHARLSAALHGLDAQRAAGQITAPRFHILRGKWADDAARLKFSRRDFAAPMETPDHG